MVRPFLFRCDFPFFVMRPSGRIIKKRKYIKNVVFLLTIHRFGGIIISERGNTKNLAGGSHYEV